MPPRRSARVAAAAPSEALLLSPLPDDVALRILNLVPVDARGRCAAVRRAWHAALSRNPCAWAHLNLSPATSGVARPVTDALLRGAARKARGELRTLDVTGCASLTLAALRDVFAANAASLRTARVSGSLTPMVDDLIIPTRFNPDDLAPLLAAAPALRELHADVLCTVGEASALLRAHAPYVPLRVTTLNVDDSCVLPRAAMRAVDFLLLALAGGPAHALDEAPALADAPEEAAALEAALRANNTLTSLHLFVARGTTLARHAGTAASVLRALEAHSSLRALHVLVSLPHTPRAVADARGAEVAAALAALLAANAPALTELCLFARRLRDDDLRPLCGALAGNSHLQRLELEGDDALPAEDEDDDGLSEAFARDVLLPAVQHNTSLRRLRVGNAGAAVQPPPSVQQAVALVEGRTAAG
jgi:hypothetical protein